MSQSKKKPSTTITFRLDEDLVKNLRVESDNRQVSTNTLVNQALRRFLQWDVFESVAGFVMINKQVFKQIFGKMKEDDVIDIATRIGKNEIKDVVLFMTGKLDLLSFLYWCKIRMINSSGQVSHTHQDGYHRFFMKHDIGKNWSIYHKTILELLFQEFFNKKIHVKATTNTISFEFTE